MSYLSKHNKLVLELNHAPYASGQLILRVSQRIKFCFLQKLTFYKLRYFET